MRPGWLALRPAWLALRPDWLSLRPAWLALGPSRGERMDGQMDGRTDRLMENLPILQDFAPYRGRCPATAHLQPKNCIKRGKGTADHMMPLDNWFIAKVKVGSTGSNHITKDVSFGFTTTTPVFANVGS